ncbi:MAG: glycosyltransferase family 39 protein [Candidatus Omnitrophica bacterium]|nr:glycosyltransferase family 39 protein [Candidatus Omnitrophota bacterium]
MKKFKTNLATLFFSILFIWIIFLITVSIKQAFEYDFDEGHNLIRFFLFAKGFSFYEQIWNDHPPLFTLILSYWFKLFKPSVYHARILVLLFSGILLWAFYQTIKNLWGHLCGFTAILLLLLSEIYIRLSISVMICLPSLSMAMLSIYCITLYKKSQLKHLLVLSGIFIALSLQIKLFTVFLIPIIALEIVYAKKRVLFSLLLWLGSFLAVYLAITIRFFHFNFSLMINQLLLPHLRQITIAGPNFSTLWEMILADYDIALLALMGIILLIRQKKWQLFFPVWWLTIALIILMLWRPIWEHYYPLISIPMCWLAAIGVVYSFKIIRAPSSNSILPPSPT